jgi:hypothetical protein
MWWNAGGRAFHHIGGPAVNYAHGRLGTAPVPAQLRRPSMAGEGMSSRTRGQPAANPRRARAAPRPVAGGDHRRLHPHDAPSPNHPGRHRGLGRRDSTQRPLPSAADQLLARRTISRQRGAVTAAVSRSRGKGRAFPGFTRDRPVSPKAGRVPSTRSRGKRDVPGENGGWPRLPSGHSSGKSKSLVPVTSRSRRSSGDGSLIRNSTRSTKARP